MRKVWTAAIAMAINLSWISDGWTGPFVEHEFSFLCIPSGLLFIIISFEYLFRFQCFHCFFFSLPFILSLLLLKFLTIETFGSKSFGTRLPLPSARIQSVMWDRHFRTLFYVLLYMLAREWPPLVVAGQQHKSNAHKLFHSFIVHHPGTGNFRANSIQDAFGSFQRLQIWLWPFRAEFRLCP